MKNFLDKFIFFAAIGVGLWFVLLGNSCNPVTIETSSDGYDTLRLRQCYWSTDIAHLSDCDGYISAHVAVVVTETDKKKFDPERDSIPYCGYNFFVEAQTQDSLLPLGRYTTKEGDVGRILIKQCCAFSAQSVLWPKPAGIRYTMKDATICIGCDSSKTKDKYYFEFFIDMDDGERLYIRSTDLWQEVRIDGVRHWFPYDYSK